MTNNVLAFLSSVLIVSGLVSLENHAIVGTIAIVVGVLGIRDLFKRLKNV